MDPDDRGAGPRAPLPDRDDAAASALSVSPDGGLGFWVAAVRETFEEAGVLLARSAATGALVDPSRAAARDGARPSSTPGSLTFGDFVETEDLVLDVGGMDVFSHWITPAGMPRRYDTWFFVAAAPDGTRTSTTTARPSRRSGSDRPTRSPPPTAVSST